jgi:hypothetical protein
MHDQYLYILFMVYLDYIVNIHIYIMILVMVEHSLCNLYACIDRFSITRDEVEDIFDG